MRLRYRTRIQISSQILQAANGENATRTKIMYKTVLSYLQLKEYLKLLTADGLLQYNSTSRTFKTTTKGLMVLEGYNQLDGIMKKGQKRQREQQQQVWDLGGQD
jgi:predicted transcriptional regulator